VTCHDVERDLDPYIDRELPPEAHVAVREHLSTCATCRQHVADREALAGVIRSLPYHQAPARLRARVAGRIRPAWSPPRLLTYAAAAVLVLSIGAGVAVMRNASVARESIVADVVDAHVRSLMADHLFDVRSTDQHTVKPWFLGKLDFSPSVTDLSSSGFPLVGGRLDYLSGRPVAALVYQRQKHTINVFVWPSADAAARVDAQTFRGFHVRHWNRGGMSFWAVSDLNDAELTEFARALQEA